MFNKIYFFIIFFIILSSLYFFFSNLNLKEFFIFSELFWIFFFFLLNFINKYVDDANVFFLIIFTLSLATCETILFSLALHGDRK